MFQKGNRIAKGNPPNKTSFKKGHISWITGTHIYTGGGHKKGTPAWNKGKNFTIKHRENLSISHKGKTGKKASNWKGGRIKRREYLAIWIPSHPFCDKQGYVLEHRLVIEQQIGRYLLLEEHCHHSNKIKNDNRPKNLMAFINNSAHRRFHKNPNNVKPNEIIFDGRKLHLASKVLTSAVPAETIP